MRPFSKRVLGVIAVAVAMTAAVFGQAVAPAAKFQPGAAALQGIGLRSIGPALASGRIQDVVIDPRNPSVRVRGHCVRRSVEDNQPRHHVRADVRRPGSLQHSAASSIDPGLERRLGRLRGEHEPEKRTFRRRRLQVDRRRQELEACGPGDVGTHRQDPDRSAQLEQVYVAAQGPLWSAGGERGLYKTTDGGATWTAVLTISGDTGVSDVVFHPKNPDIALRVVLSAAPRRRTDGRRRSRRGDLQVHQCGQDLDEADERTAERRRRTRRARRSIRGIRRRFSR